jgi:transposase
MSLREEYLNLAVQPGANWRELCRRFEIAPKTAYMWLKRYAERGSGGLKIARGQPRLSSQRTAAELEQHVLRIRCDARRDWRARKLAHRLRVEGGP